MNPVSPPRILPGGGEMGERIRRFDWSKTPIGPIAQWPSSLVTSVRIMLASRQPIWIGWGPEFIYLYNDAYKAIIGGRHPSALGKPSREVWPEIWDIIGPMLRSAMGGAEGTYVEEQLLIMQRHGFNEETYYTYSYTPIPDGEGTGGIICANTDDTQRVIGRRRISLLQELAASADARNAQEVCDRVSAALATNSKDLPFALIYLLDSSGKNLALSGRAGIWHGHAAAPASVSLKEDGVWPFAQVLQSNALRVVDVAGVPDLPAGAWPQSPEKAVVLPLAAGAEGACTGVMIAGLNPFRKFTEQYQLFLSLVSIQIAAAITNARSYEEERKRAESLAELDRAKTTFFSNVSHELRTPLTLMLGPIEDELREHPETRPRLELAHRNAQRLLKLVNTLLDFSRIEAGRVQMMYEPTDLAAYTSELAEGFRPAMQSAGLEFEVDCPSLPDPIFLDREVWEKVVLNLLSNAFKFTLKGKVTVKLRGRDNGAELTVQDTGMGIPEAELPRLFQRFHRVRNSEARTHEGTGIGLALVQELVQLHHGQIRANSVEGQGTIFTVTIPAGTQHSQNAHCLSNRSQARTATGSASFIQEANRWLPDVAESGNDSIPEGKDDDSETKCAAKILVAEDNADMRKYVTRLLRKHYNVIAVADGQAALEAVRAEHPDLVLSDIMMPRMDGFELLRELRAHADTSTIPVIFLSARAGEEARIEGMSKHADDYLAKPFSSRELLTRVSTHLGLAKVRRKSETALRESEQKFRNSFESEKAARQEAENAMRMKDNFLATLSHELRTPLNPVLLIASDAVVNPDVPADIRENFEVILKNIEVEVKLIDDLLDLSRITHGKLNLNMRTVDAHVALQDALQTVQNQILGKDIQTALEFKASQHMISADSVRLQQIFWNVLRNAVKFTPEHGNIRIETFSGGGGDRFGVTITDSGIGMTPEELTNVFAAFSQGEYVKNHSAEYGGMGLGLAISKKLVEIHSGSIRATSDGRGRGASFTIEFPLAK
ncbi:MAG TPA: ATP-binding protein [Verrucomicrobiae bacterium]|nr:ATP-binding protein [Verrucomicrobiae bacterium]